MSIVEINLVIAAIILAVTFFLFFFLRFRMSKWWSGIPVAGVFIAGVIAYFPLNTEYNSFSTFIASLVDTGRLFFLNSDYFETIAEVFLFTGGESIFGEIIFAILFILAPLCTAILIISLISDAITYLGVSIPLHRNKYVFSSLNEKTFSLAKSMKEKNMKGLYIFCNVPRHKRNENPYYDDAKNLNFITIENSILKIKPSFDINDYLIKKDDSIYKNNPLFNIKNHKKLEKLLIKISKPLMHIKKVYTYYFAISDNSTENLDYTLKLLENYHTRSNVKIYITSNEAEDEALLDDKINKIVKIGKEKQAARDKQTAGEIQTVEEDHRYDYPRCYLSHINESLLIAYNLLMNNPIYEAVNKDKNKVSMLIIGGGCVGLEILKNTLWSSKSIDCEFEATILDKDIEHSRKIFKRYAPYLDLDKYNVNFYPINIDAETSDIIDYISCGRYHPYNYIVISTDNDEINIRACQDLEAWYKRKGEEVTISLVLRDKQKSDLINTYKNENKNTNSKVNLFTLGGDTNLYTYDRIIHNYLEYLAIFLNQVYNRTWDYYNTGKTVKVEYEEALQSWKKVLPLKKRSSMASSIFIKYILHSMGYDISTDNSGVIQVNPKLESYPISDKDIEKYSELEHNRWNIYQMTEGYYPWDYNDYKEFYKGMKKEDWNTNNKERRLHLCITDWETLNKIDKEENTHISDYDREYIQSIPEILEKAEKAYKGK